MRIPAPLVVALVTICAQFAQAQTTDTTRRATRATATGATATGATAAGATVIGATVSGVVHDSLSYRPLVGATVQLVSTDSLVPFVGAAITDALGRYVLRDVPDGRFMIGFVHPVLDSLTLEPPLRALSVSMRRAVRMDLAIPSAARFRVIFCGPRSTADSGAVVVGVVRDAANGTPAADVAVAGEWLELSISAHGIERRVPRRVTRTRENGWFVLCDVPSRGTMTLLASRGIDSTDVIEVQVPVDGFLRRELAIGPARTILVHDSAHARDSVPPPPRRVRWGEGKLHGTVMTASYRRPLPHARVSIANGPTTLANEKGEWSLTNAPLGSRILEVRAVGFYPERRAVEIIPESAPVQVELTTLKAVLDTVRVAGRRVLDPYLIGFEQRRLHGIGHFFTAAEIARRQPDVISELLHLVPGMQLQRTANPGDGTLILVHGAYDDWCSPTVYLNGNNMGELSAEDVDIWVRPKKVSGIEIYSGAFVPPEFSRGMAGTHCGSIVIWAR